MYLVFPNAEGNYQDGRNLTQRVLPKLLKEANLAPITWHQLRHTCISALAEAHVNPSYIQHQAGHSNFKITSEIYTHVSEGMNRQAQTALNKVFLVST